VVNEELDGHRGILARLELDRSNLFDLLERVAYLVLLNYLEAGNRYRVQLPGVGLGPHHLRPGQVAVVQHQDEAFEVQLASLQLRENQVARLHAEVSQLVLEDLPLSILHFVLELEDHLLAPGLVGQVESDQRLHLQPCRRLLLTQLLPDPLDDGVVHVPVEDADFAEGGHEVGQVQDLDLVLTVAGAALLALPLQALEN